MRTQELDESLLRELGESMRVKQLQRIIVTPDYTVVSGNRRGLAALLVGLETVEVEVLPAMPSESLLLMYQFAENFFREGVSDWDKCQTSYRLLQLNTTWKGKDVAEFLRIDPSMVVRLMSFTKCCVEVRNALRDGKIGIGTAYALSKEPEEKQLGLLQMKLDGASRDDIERVRRKAKRKWNGSSGKATRITILLAEGVMVVISGPGLTTEGVLSACGDIQKEAKRAADKNHTVKTFESTMRDRLKGGA
jgi:ParB-like chromosome segregation protein Spo0J